ncbi:hypothetical protein GC093_11640 [Paenibacillus sp. LMG 31456]|uniref:Uncharacterized protein n=1 Tax=Paenibacillus foliorum TaxID=2654974 RepID=A0A972GTG1_9BACL|nr:hypothetical protein [Paenibacillus foliorum]NOU93873.1 hypothetical protein [Paenibacillus foliorum]
MVNIVTQVSRTYRTQALWNATEDAWKRAFKQPGSLSSRVPGTATPYKEGNSYIRFALSTARSVSTVITAAHQLKQTNDKLISSSSSSSAKHVTPSEEFGLEQTSPSADLDVGLPEPGTPNNSTEIQSLKHEVQELVDHYNGLHAAIYDTTPPLKNGTADPLMSKLADISLKDLGIQPNTDGTLTLDTDAFEEQATGNFNRYQLNLRGPDGLAHALTNAAQHLLTQPSEQLLDKQQGLFQAFTNYRFQAWGGNSIRTYLPVPLTGMLLNSYLG